MFVTDVAMLNTRRHVSFFSLRFTTRPTLLSKGGFGVHTALSRGMAQTLPPFCLRVDLEFIPRCLAVWPKPFHPFI